VVVSEVGLQLHYFTWGDLEFASQFQDLVDTLRSKEVSVGQVASVLFCILESDLRLLQNYNVRGSSGNGTNKFGSCTAATPIFEYVRAKLVGGSRQTHQKH